MLDFTSSLYLGLQHPAATLEPWAQLTLGVPAALKQPPAADRLSRRLAQLIGCERATLARSTLHLFWDLLGILTRQPAFVCLEAGAYPVGRWAAERVRVRGVVVRRFAHHDPTSLSTLLADGSTNGRPIVCCDGFCPGCGRPAPLADYLSLVRAAGGLLVIDDTQALGILGEPIAGKPYGLGGGGSLRAHQLAGPEILVISSLAKAFGAPLAVLAGSARSVRGFEAASTTRIHSSPPSRADLHAALRALGLNAADGDRRRHRLAALIGLLHRRLEPLQPRGWFPVQHLPRVVDAGRLYRRLVRSGLHSVLTRPSCQQQAHVALMVTARHRSWQIERAGRLIRLVVGELHDHARFCVHPAHRHPRSDDRGFTMTRLGSDLR